MTCSDCPFSTLVNVAQRECHFDPPKIIPGRDAAGNVGFSSVWPVVGSENWCGKHPGRSFGFTEDGQVFSTAALTGRPLDAAKEVVDAG